MAEQKKTLRKEVRHTEALEFELQEMEVLLGRRKARTLQKPEPIDEQEDGEDTNILSNVIGVASSLPMALFSIFDKA